MKKELVGLSQRHVTALRKHLRQGPRANLQPALGLLTHLVPGKQEHERTAIRRELQDEIAQTRLGINVRRPFLKQEARSNTKGLKNEISSTQRLVLKSAKSVRRVARDLGIRQQA